MEADFHIGLSGAESTGIGSRPVLFSSTSPPSTVLSLEAMFGHREGRPLQKSGLRVLPEVCRPSSLAPFLTKAPAASPSSKGRLDVKHYWDLLVQYILSAVQWQEAVGALKDHPQIACSLQQSSNSGRVLMSQWSTNLLTTCKPMFVPSSKLQANTSRNKGYLACALCLASPHPTSCVPWAAQAQQICQE